MNFAEARLGLFNALKQLNLTNCHNNLLLFPNNRQVTYTILTTCAVTALLIYSTFEPSLQLSSIVLISFLASAALSAAIILRICHLSKRNELQVSLTSILKDFERSLLRETNKNVTADSAASSSVFGGFSHVGMVYVYRNLSWCKIPIDLLVNGDIIALNSGDIAPCRLSELTEESADSIAYKRSGDTRWIKGSQIAAGSFITWDHTTSGKSKRGGVSPGSGKMATSVLSSDSPELLKLCGNMRCFAVEETPLPARLERLTESKEGQQQASASVFSDSMLPFVFDLLRRYFFYLLSMMIILLVLRGLLSTHTDNVNFSIISPLCSLLLLALPIVSGCLFLSQIVSLISNAILFSAINDIHRNKQSKDKISLPLPPTIDESDDHHMIREGNHGRERQPRKQHTTTWERLFFSNFFRSKNNTRSTNDKEDKFIEKVKICLSFLTLWQVLKRTYLCAMNYSSAENVELILSQPAATQSLVEALGAVSMVCFVDDDLVCDNSAVCEEILLMSDNPHTTDTATGGLASSKTGLNTTNVTENSTIISGKGELGEQPQQAQTSTHRNLEVSAKSIVLDLYTQKGGQQNEQHHSRFENPLWFNYLLALKPLGLAALLDNAHDERGGNRPSSYNIPGNNAPNNNSSIDNMSAALAKRKLVDNVIKRVRYTSLADLATQIGFTQQDADLFTPICDINVVAPRLEAAYFESDRHEMSLEEGRRRGYLVPTLRAGICRDTNRNGGLQMTSVGDPQLVLSYCKEYWDGSSRSITPLAPADRQSILQVFDRWRLEDFDVLALSYSPLPDAPFMETFFRSVASSTKRVPKHHHHHMTTSSAPRYSSSWSQHQQQQEQQQQQQQEYQPVLMRPSIYFVDPSAGIGASNSSRGTHQVQTAVEATEDISVTLKEEQVEQHDELIVEQVSSLSYMNAYNQSQSQLLEDANEDLELLAGDFTPIMSSATTHHAVHHAAADYLQEDENQDESFGRAQTAPAKTKTAAADKTPLVSKLQLESTLLTRPVSVNEGLDVISGNTTRSRAKSDAGRLLRLRLESDHDQDDENLEYHHDKHNHHHHHHHEKLPITRKAKEAEDYHHPPLQVAMTMPNLPRHTTNRRDKSTRRLDKTLEKSFDKYHEKLSKSEEYIHARRQIWTATRQQIFLGMVASSVSIREEIPSIKEQLDESGVRFIYFSARNMKRSKPIAEKIGIPFDWNCAISLRALDCGNKNDPHRYISNYADWDVMARMPHGIEAIRQHLLTVDNVPLLVSLFSDAVPETVEDMLGIFREYGETVLVIGGGYRSYNRNIFQAADLACSVYCLPFTKIPSNREDIFTNMGDKTTLSRADYLLVLRLVGLGTINLLQQPVDCSETAGYLSPSSSPFLSLLPPQQTADEVEVSVLLRLIHLSRKLLLNKLQIFAFVITSIVTLILIVVLLQAIPLTVSITIPPFMVGFCILIVIPMITLSMIFNDDSNVNVMKLTPRKRNFVVKPVDIRRFTVYLLMRAMSVAVPAVLCGYFTASSVFQSSLRFDGDQDITTDSAVLCKVWLVQDMVVNASILGVVVQSCYFQWRGYSLSKERLHNTTYLLAVSLVLCVYCVIMFFRSSWRNCQFGGHQAFYAGMDCTASKEYVGYASVSVSAWICFAFTALLTVFVAEVVNSHDIKFYQRHMQFLRFEFDTRLGMHSPR